MPCELTARSARPRTARARSTERPRRDSDHAAAAPASPAPMITTSDVQPRRGGYRRAGDVRTRLRRPTTAQDLLADLDAWLRIPGISAQPEHHADVAAQRRVVRRGRRGAPASRPSRSGRRAGLPAVYAEWPSDDADAPDRARLRPPRRAAGRPARAVAHRPVRPDRRRRRAARPRRVRRQGPAAVPPARPARAPRRHRAHARPAVTLKFLIEGEEESGSPNFEELLAEHRDRLDCRRRRHHRHRHDRRRTCRARSPACAAWSACTVDLPRPRPRPALGRVRRRGAQPGDRARPAGRRAARRRRPGAGARLLRRRRSS